MSIRYYFDMDGVLADWVDQYNSVSDMPLSEFNSLSREDRELIKMDLFDYNFFYNMQPIQSGLDLLNEKINQGFDVCILSASGRVNRDEVIRAKKDWILLHIGNINAMFVDKVEMKSQKMDQNIAENILIDDRQIAIDAWNQAGGIGILFE